MKDLKEGALIFVCRSATTEKLVTKISTMAGVQLRSITGHLIRTAARKTNSYFVCGLSTTSGINNDVRSKTRGLKYEFLSEHRMTEAAVLITEELLKHSPMIRHLKIPQHVYLQRNMALLEQAMRSGEALVAIDENSEKIVGVSVAVIVSSLDQFAYFVNPTACEQYRPVGLVASRLAGYFFEFEEIKTLQSTGEQFLGIEIGVIKESYWRTGLLTVLVNLSMESARLKGVRFVFARTVNTQGDLFMNKLNGFEELGEIFYRDFDIDGVKPFEDIDPQYKSAKIYICRSNLVPEAVS
ncbi:uncharacterized protein [Ptychodera flava]|uniref:uncharacterized protein n=1 Tax=Ptychodera flava TaxID=63121 RepID=UPI00396A3207